MNQPDPVIFNLPDFRNWSDSLVNSSANLFRGNMFPITPSQLSRSFEMSSINDINKYSENMDKTSKEEICEICQMNFCNKYYLKRHKFEVHKIGLIENPDSNFQVLHDTQQRSSLFQPYLFNPLLNTSLSNFLLQKSIAPMFSNILLPQSSIPQFNQMKSELSTNSTPALSQSGFRSSESGSMIHSLDLLLSCNNSFQNKSLSEYENKVHKSPTSMFNDVCNSFIKLPLESKPIININLVENQFRDQYKNISCTICGIQLSGGESALLDHLYICHKIDKFNNMSTISKISPIKESPLSPIINGESYVSPFDAFRSSMAAAKLADRVSCDICHKDLCNKYFLRTHKLKLHGIQTVDSNVRYGNRKDKGGIYDQPSPQFDQLNLSSNFNALPFPGSSLPVPDLPSLFQNNIKPNSTSVENDCLCPVCKRVITLPYFLPLHLWNVHRIGIGNPNSFLPTVSITSPIINPSTINKEFFQLGIQSKIDQTLFPSPFGTNNVDSNIGTKWYRKSPNQMRVRCDICEKWICNKYFLRTHKLNKHGLTDSSSNNDVNSDTVSRGYFVDTSTAFCSSITNIDNRNNFLNSSKCCANSPIDLSTSFFEETNEKNSSSISSMEKNKISLPRISSNSTISDVYPKCMLNCAIGLKWPLKHTLEKMNNISSTSVSNTNNSTPLDLSIKSNKNLKKSINEYDFAYRQSLVIYTAKKLKLKYQKIYRSKCFQQIPATSQQNSSLLKPSFYLSKLTEGFCCPLCSKEFQDAPRFLHHLTKFHDMVLPGHHTRIEVSSNIF